MKQVKYKREAGHNYLVLNGMENRDYRLRMVLENKIPGLLPLTLRRWNGEEEYYYDITSLQPLDVFFGKKQINYEALKHVLNDLYCLEGELKRFLLDREDVPMRPEYCFYDGETYKSAWLFYPEEGESYEGLGEFFLEHVDYGDAAAVDVVYRFYKYVREDGFVMERIMEYMAEKYPEQWEDNAPVVEEISTPEEDFLWENKGSAIPDTDVKSREGKSFLNSLASFDFKGFFKKGERRREELREEKTAVPRESFYMPSQEIQRDKNWGKTMVLGVSPEKKNHLRSVNGKSVIPLPEKLPCVFGKMEDSVDVVIPSPNVSRIHARIYEKDGKIYLQDMNSLNGTSKNGFPLEANESVELCPGDEIAFANQEYIYE